MLISIIIPTCNSPFTLDLAVKSVLSQIEDFGEIIVVNDGYRPLHNQWMYSDARVKVVENFPRSIDFLNYPSGGYSRNKGLEVACGKYIAFLDDDDWFEPGKIKHQLTAMESNKLDATCTDAFISIWPIKLGYPRRKFSNFYKRELQDQLKAFEQNSMPKVIDEKMLEMHNFIITSTVICSAAIIKMVGGFNNIKSHGQLINGKLDFEDWNLWRRISKICPFHYIDAPYVHYKRGSIKKLVRRVGRILSW